MEKQLELIMVNMNEIFKRQDQRHAEMMAMLEDLGKSLITIEEQINENVQKMQSIKAA